MEFLLMGSNWKLSRFWFSLMKLEVVTPRPQNSGMELRELGMAVPKFVVYLLQR